ncbi:MAG: hypothetical protein ACREHD_32590, partial [Pirellulales bacterium]
GLHSWTLRGWGLVANLMATLLFLLAFSRLRKLQILDGVSFLVVAALLITNFATISVARWGRPEPVAMCFIAAAFLSLAADLRHPRALQVRCVLAGLFLGLAIGTHTVAAIYFIPFVVSVGYAYGRTPRTLGRAFLIILIPPAVFALIWIAAFGGNSLEAIQQHLLIGKLQGNHGLRLFELYAALKRLDARHFVQAGGTTVVIVVLSGVLLATRWVLLTVQRRYGVLRRWLGALGIVLILQGAMIAGVTGLDVVRAYVVFPIAVFAIALALTEGSFFRAASHSSVDMEPAAQPWGTLARSFRILTVTVLFAVVLCEVAQGSGYALKIRREWSARAPSRIDRSVAELRRYPNICVTSRFWYCCEKHGIRFRVLADGVKPVQDYVLEHPEMLCQFDAVVLPIGHPLLADGRWQARVAGEFPLFQGERYVIVETKRYCPAGDGSG